MPHAVKNEKDLDNLVLRLMLLNTPKAKVERNSPKSFLFRSNPGGIHLVGSHGVLPQIHAGCAAGTVTCELKTRVLMWAFWTHVLAGFQMRGVFPW